MRSPDKRFRIIFYICRIMIQETIEECFEKSFKDNLYKVQYYAYNYLKNKELSENVAQEAFLILWENRGKVNFNENVLPYLLFVTRNLSLNLLRKEKNHLAYMNYTQRQSMESLNYASLMDSSATQLYSKEIEGLLQKGMAKMPDKVKETFILCRVNGLSHKEIMDIQGISIKTIESRITIALKVLRKIFKDFIVLIIGLLLS